MLTKLMIDMKNALKNKDKTKLLALRNMISTIKAKQIDIGKTLSDDEISKILQGISKKLKDSIVQYKNGNRNDLVKTEEIELKVVESYLPKQLNKNQLKKIIHEVIIKCGATSMADIKNVMPILMTKIAGKGDGKLASTLVREILQK